MWLYEDGGELLHYPDTGEITSISGGGMYLSYDSVNDIFFASGRAGDDFPVTDGMLDADRFRYNTEQVERRASGDGVVDDPYLNHPCTSE